MPRISDLPRSPIRPDPRDRFLGRVVNAGKERSWGIRLWDYCEANAVNPELLLVAVLRGKRPVELKS